MLLAMKTNAADTRIGSHSRDSGTISTSFGLKRVQPFSPEPRPKSTVDGHAHSQTYSQKSAPFARHFVSVTRALFAPHMSMAFLCHPTTVRQSWRENVGAS